MFVDIVSVSLRVDAFVLLWTFRKLPVVLCLVECGVIVLLNAGTRSMRTLSDKGPRVVRRRSSVFFESFRSEEVEESVAAFFFPIGVFFCDVDDTFDVFIFIFDDTEETADDVDVDDVVLDFRFALRE